MSSKRLFPVLSSLLLVMVPVVAYGASQAGNVTITATVDKFFQWPAGMAVTIAPNFNGVSQTRTTTATFNCFMNHTDPTTVQASALVADGKNGILKDDVSGKVLTTAYGLEGAGVSAGADGAGLTPNNAAAFFAKTYTIDNAAVGTKEIKLTVSGTTDADPANAPAGTYNCTIVLTATF